jgi:hypothetical protein
MVIRIAAYGCGIAGATLVVRGRTGDLEVGLTLGYVLLVLMFVLFLVGHGMTLIRSWTVRHDAPKTE